MAWDRDKRRAELEALAEDEAIAAIETALATVPNLAADADTFNADALLKAIRANGYIVERRGRPTWQRISDQLKEEEAEAEAAAKAERLAKALPYSGAIHTCQATVPLGGRMVGHRRCSNRARFVVRRNKVMGALDKLDGRLAVCRTHAEDKYSYRYTQNNRYDQPSAHEPVEPEYQPEENA